MSELRQRLLPIARQPLALVGALRDVLRERDRARRSHWLTQPAASPRRQRVFKFYTASLRRTVERWRREAEFRGASSEPVAGALVKISEGGRALMTLPAKGQGARQARARAGPARAQENLDAAAPMSAARYSPASWSSA